MAITKICTFSGKDFVITDEELDFYQRMRVPTPTLSPRERLRRRLAFRNERNLYRRDCDRCKKPTVTVYAPNNPVKMYCAECWWGDGWNAASYARAIDFSRPFFVQFQELMLDVPHLALWNHQSQNSEYNNCAFFNKNCYMNFATDHCEDSCFNYMSERLIRCFDCTAVLRSELCYQCVNCEDCYESIFLQDCKTVANSAFLRSCIGCNNCFGCVNLRNKSYCYFNQQLSKIEYEQKLATINLGSFAELSRVRKEFSSFQLDFPHKFAQHLQSENVSGSYIRQSRNCINCFDVCGADNVFNANYTLPNVKNASDVYALTDAENCYECSSGVQINDSRFILWVTRGPNSSDYCISCVNNSRNLFGCVGMSQAEYCIFNRQYSADEFFSLRTQLIEQMQANGEWGEFFPIHISPFGYNETIAQDMLPITQAEAENSGWSWQENDYSTPAGEVASEIPDRIEEVSDEILAAVLVCAETGKKFKLQKSELEFYRLLNLPVPRQCLDVRHRQRIALKTPHQLWQRNCDNCGMELESPYEPQRSEKIFCENCYLAAVD